VVVIDPGHGGPDPGAIGIGGLRETDIVLDIGQQVTSLLERQGITVVLTRNGEYDLGLEPRVQMAERANATIFVSIHANAMPANRTDISGIETYYYDSGKQLASVIHQTILEDTGARDRRIRQARFYVIRRTTMPAVLVEVGFVTGVEDATQLNTPAYRSRMAAAIARGILRYLGQGG
jgi:N-acetylmuramoyl-L-alanine amidase